METLAVVATKGGVGKTTLAIHLAVAAQHDGLKVLILDLDRQGSTAQWGKDREKLARDHGAWFTTALVVRRVFDNELAEAVEQGRQDGFDFVIIDTPPQADYAAARAIEMADMVLMPVRPAYLDLHASKPTIALLRDKGVNAAYVINQLPHNSVRIAADAAEFLDSKGMKGAPVHITLLAPYSRAFSNGLTAPELVPDGRHAQEIKTLWEFVKAECAAAQPQPAAREPVRIEAARDSILGDPLAMLLGQIRGDAA